MVAPGATLSQAIEPLADQGITVQIMSRLLIVDDDRTVCEMIRESLEHNNHIVEIANDGESALACLKTYEYDLLVLDWEMPGMSGIQLLERFRKDGGKIPVLMLTGKSAINEKEKGFDCGADDYLTKPFDMRELLMRVKALLRRPAEIASNCIKAGDLLLEPDKVRVTKADEEIELTRREFILLEFLMKHPGQVFSPEDLLDRVWSMETDPSVDALRQCVVRIRRKIDSKGKPTMIQNIYGLGYKFQKD